jgi:hypothetical protein
MSDIRAKEFVVLSSPKPELTVTIMPVRLPLFTDVGKIPLRTLIEVEPTVIFREVDGMINKDNEWTDFTKMLSHAEARIGSSGYNFPLREKAGEKELSLAIQLARGLIEHRDIQTAQVLGQLANGDFVNCLVGEGIPLARELQSLSTD